MKIRVKREILSEILRARILRSTNLWSRISFSAEIYGARNPRDKILRNRISKMRNTEFCGFRFKILKFKKYVLQIKF
nr:hypothetical protein [uncultured Campylobacter sp.]